MRLAILGAGAWGTALAVSFAPRHQVTLWSRDAGEIEVMVRERYNQRFLPDVPLPAELRLSTSLNDTLADAELVIVAVPVAGLRSTLQQLASLPSPVSVIWVCKGFESETSRFPHQIAEEVLPAAFPRGVLSGPSFAQEVARNQPTAMTLASSDGEFAQRTAKALHHPRLRIYSSTDVVGVEIGGAVKNVLAIAAGICDGMQMGLNARAALLTRGLAEMSRLGLKMGGKAETLGGLSGVGDLILTCTGDLSRNRQVGMLLAQHKSLANILNELGHVAEGVYTAREVHRIAQQQGVDMPICEGVYRVLYENLAADKAVEALLSRQPGHEF
ncbi:MAG: NAD(P)-dependent glycerol-3-phosphate dehydrogenase [Nitrosomonadales bacterium]|nr:NAD(P)-dependent glycerol-3-phosphate dehydrogenase [Nitrosomonadales bacterium]